MAQSLSTDTAVQQSVADEIGTTSMSEKTTVESILAGVQAMQGGVLDGETGQATQAKAAHLHEVGIALTQHLESIAERVGQSAGSYMNVDADGAGAINASASLPF